MSVVAVDFESHLISNEEPIPRPVCLSFYDGTETGLLVGQDMEKFLETHLSAKTLLIAHNATFELLVIYQHFPKLRELLIQSLDEGRWFCTQLYQQLLDNLEKSETFDKSLAGLVNKYYKKDISAGKTNPDAWRLRYSELDGVPLEEWPEAAKEYAIMDSVYAYKIYNTQTRINKNIEFSPHIMASFCLNWIAARGILVEKDRVNTLEIELNAKLEPIHKKLEAIGFIRRDKNGLAIKNTALLRDYVSKNFKSLRYTKKGAVQVDGDALDFYCVEKDDTTLRDFRFISQYEKAKTAFLARLKTADPVIRTGYNAIVRSGRTSSRTSSAYPSVNIQQQPRALKDVTWDVRNCYIPRPGYKLVTIDYNNLELLSCAHQLYSHFGQSNMRDIINSGTEPVDLHSKFACALMSMDKHKQITYEEFVKNKKKEGWKEYRAKAKPVTLGVPGGMGYDTIRTQFNKEGIRLPYEILERTKYEVVARRLVRKYSGEFPAIRVHRTGYREWAVVYDEIVKLKKVLFTLYPELQTFLRHSHEKFQTGEFGWTKNDFNEWEKEPYYKYDTLGVQRNYCTYTAFCNGYLLQAPSAVGAKLACVNTFKEFRNSDEVYMLGFVHDEELVEIRDNNNLYKNIDIVSEIMLTSMKCVLNSVRIAVEAEVKDYWSKDVCISSKTYWMDHDSTELKWK